LRAPRASRRESSRRSEQVTKDVRDLRRRLGEVERQIHALEARLAELGERLGDPALYANGEHVRARSVVIASGATYRRLPLGNLTEFEGGSVHYWASPSEAKLCAGQEIALVGAGNSAGQAVVYLASQVAKVWLITRRASLKHR